jgi:hypothetical protein
MVDEFLQKPNIPYMDIFRKNNEVLTYHIPTNEKSILNSI